jgi:hypothetical protein
MKRYSKNVPEGTAEVDITNVAFIVKGGAVVIVGVPEFSLVLLETHDVIGLAEEPNYGHEN